MRDDKKVAVIVHNTSPGGVQRVGISEVAWLHKACYEAVLISILKSREWDLIKKLDVKTIYLSESNEFLGRLFNTLLIDRLVSKFKYTSPDFIIAHNIPGGQVALGLRKYLKGNKLKKPIVLYLHDPLVYPIAGSLYSICAKYFPSTLLKIEEKIIQNVDIIFTNSKRTLIKLIKIHKKKSDIRDRATVLYPTINIPIPEHEIKKERKRYLLIVGRIDHEAFFNVYKIMEKINMPFVIAGSYHPYNMNAWRTLHLLYRLKNKGKKIKLILNPSDEELLGLYKNALLFVYPGHENFNMSAIEAMSVGCPILVADTSGVCEILPTNLREYLCLPKTNINHWISRIIEIVRNNESYRLGKRCWEITQRYNIHTHMDKLMLFLKMLSDRADLLKA